MLYLHKVWSLQTFSPHGGLNENGFPQAFTCCLVCSWWTVWEGLRGLASLEVHHWEGGVGPFLVSSLCLLLSGEDVSFELLCQPCLLLYSSMVVVDSPSHTVSSNKVFPL